MGNNNNNSPTTTTTPTSTKSTTSRLQNQQTPNKPFPQNPSTIHTGPDHIQKLLDENSYLISIICQKQQDGNIQPVGKNHEILQKNLAYLASLAEYQHNNGGSNADNSNNNNNNNSNQKRKT